MEVIELRKVTVNGHPLSAQDGRLYVLPPGVFRGEWHIALYGITSADYAMLASHLMSDTETVSVKAFPAKGRGAFTGRAFVTQIDADYVKLQGTGELGGYY